MSDLIQFLSQTPLPTILVVAGILFLFLSIGGRLGAQITTDIIKRKSAGILGVVLLTIGLSLSLAGQLRHHNPQEPTLPKVVRDNSYLLRADSVPPGRVTEEKSQFRLSEGTLTLQSGEEHVIGKINIVSSDSSKLEVLSSSDGRPTVLKETILSDVTKTTTHVAEDVTTDTENGVLSGHSILIEKKGGTWIRSLLGAEPTEAQRTELRSPYADEYETYPAGAVEIGTTWTLDGPQVAYFSGLGNLLSVDGSASMTFERLVDCGGDKCAIISVRRLELSGEMLDEGNVVRFKLGGSGAIHRSLSRFIDTKYSFEGTMKMNTEMLVEGKKVELTVVGPFEANANEDLISE